MVALSVHLTLLLLLLPPERLVALETSPRIGHGLVARPTISRRAIILPELISSRSKTFVNACSALIPRSLYGPLTGALNDISSFQKTLG